MKRTELEPTGQKFNTVLIWRGRGQGRGQGQGQGQGRGQEQEQGQGRGQGLNSFVRIVGLPLQGRRW